LTCHTLQSSAKVIKVHLLNYNFSFITENDKGSAFLQQHLFQWNAEAQKKKRIQGGVKKSFFYFSNTGKKYLFQKWRLSWQKWVASFELDYFGRVCLALEVWERLDYTTEELKLKIISQGKRPPFFFIISMTIFELL